MLSVCDHEDIIRGAITNPVHEGIKLLQFSLVSHSVPLGLFWCLWGDGVFQKGVPGPPFVPGPRALGSTAVLWEARDAAPPPGGSCRRSWGRAGRRPWSSSRRRHSGARGNPSALQGKQEVKVTHTQRHSIPSSIHRTIVDCTTTTPRRPKSHV